MAEHDDTPTPEVTSANPTPEKTVPYTRFQQVVSSKNELSSRIQALEAENLALSEKTATVDTLSASVEEWKGKAEAAEGKYTRWQGIASKIGTTDSEAIEAAEWAYSRLPEQDRPDLPAWLDTIKEDPSKAPKVLSPWLSDPEPQPEPKVKPTTPRRGAQPPGAPSSVSPEALRAARDHAVRTGDWSRYRELQTARGVRTSVK